MHDWAAVSNWSRPSTNLSGRTDTRLSRLSSGRLTINVPALSPRFGLSRCQTTLEHESHQVYKPRKRYCESCTVDYIRHLETRNKESEAKLKNTMHVLSMQRSKSDLDNRDTPQMVGGNLVGAGLLRERSQIYLTNIPDTTHRDSVGHGNKQEMKIGVAMVPRKGLISLSTNDHAELQPMAVQGERRRSSVLQQESHSAKSKSLIKRKDILEQIKLGNKLLEDAEAEKRKEEELTKSLGDYTILDLQSKLLEMTDTRSARRGFSGHNLEIQPTQGNQRKTTVSKPEKSVTLPAIKNFNPFM